MIAKKHNIDWDDLRLFLAIAENRSLSGAARQLGVYHSTVFRRINQFEENISVRLFERLPDGYQLTQAGEEMVGYASKIRDQVDQLSLQVIGKDVEPAGDVRLTAPDSLAYYYINGYLAAFCNKYPRINVELIVSNQDLDLSRRETDVAIRATDKPPPHLIGRKIFSVPWAFYASKQYLRSAGEPKSISELPDHKLIGPEGAVARLKAYRFFEKKLMPQYQLRGNTLIAIASLTSAGCGIALLPDDHARIGLIRLFTLKPIVTSDIWALTHPELRATERVRLLMQFIVEEFQQDEVLKALVI